MSEEHKKVVNLTYPILVVLLLIAAFLAGSFLTKTRYEKSGVKKAGESAQQATQVSPVAQPTLPPFEAKKSGKPVVKFFVMSYCPYGIQAESGLEPVYQLLKDQVDWQPRFVIYSDYCARASADQKTSCEKQYCLKSGNEIYCSMHGIAELNQDIREICAFKMGNLDKWWQFVTAKNKNCTVNDVETCWKAQAQAAGLDTSKIQSCLDSQLFTLAKAETEEMAKYQVSGSPQVFINEVEYNGGRAPEDYKKAICDSFESAPSECQTSLGAASSDTPAGGCN